MGHLLEVLAGGVVSGAIFALVAVGFSLIFRVSGVLNLAQGAFVVLGILVTYTLETRWRWPLPAAVAGSVAVAAGLGALIEVAVLRRAVSRLQTSGILILTAGLLTFLEGATLLLWGSQPYAAPSFSGDSPIVIGGLHISSQELWVAGAAAAVLLALWFLLARTVFGRALRATGENEVAASLVGVDVPTVRLLAYAGGAGLGALAGAVAGPLLSVQFDTGRFFTNAGFIAVALGGMGSFFGSLAGGLALGVVEQVAAGYISSLFSPTLAFLMLLTVLLVRPSGILGREPRREDALEAAARARGLALRLRGRRGLALAAAAAVVIAILPYALAGSGLLESLVITGVFFIAVLGLDLLMGFAGQVSLGHAAFMAVGAYGAGIATVRYQAPPLGGLLAGLAASLAIALVLSLVTARLRGLYLALATLGFGLLTDSLLVGLNGLTGGPSGLVGIPGFSVGGVVFDGQADYYLVWGVAGVLLLLAVNLVGSGYGRALMAIRADQTAARALGVRVAAYKASALMLSAGFASIAGSLYAFNFHFLSPEMVSTSRSLEMVTMLVVGGQGTLVGPLLGAALVTLLPALVQPLNTFKTLGEGALLIAVLLYLPGGLSAILLPLGGSRRQPVLAR
jgi:branched-chain amino acid transport system permease protein